jgi:hypothetical protein
LYEQGAPVPLSSQKKVFQMDLFPTLDPASGEVLLILEIPSRHLSYWPNAKHLTSF